MKELKAIIESVWTLDRLPDNSVVKICTPQWVNLADRKLQFAANSVVIGVRDIINNADGGRATHKAASVVFPSIKIVFEYREKRWTGLRADVIINGQSVDVEDFCDDEDMPKWASQLE